MEILLFSDYALEQYKRSSVKEGGLNVLHLTTVHSTVLQHASTALYRTRIPSLSRMAVRIQVTYSNIGMCRFVYGVFFHSESVQFSQRRRSVFHANIVQHTSNGALSGIVSDHPNRVFHMNDWYKRISDA